MQNSKRKYFEVWGDLEAQNNTLKLILFLIIGLFSISLFFCYRVTIKPPVVIRVTDIGEAKAIVDYPLNHRVSEPELFYFAKLFIKKFTEYNSYTVSTDMAEAFELMTGKYQKIAKREMIDSNLIAKISQASLHTKIEIREIKVEREDENYAVMSFLGLRTLRSYETRDFLEESLFKGDIILKKTPRTMERPHGLLVEEYREILVKELN